jgi:hypothetical protein
MNDTDTGASERLARLEAELLRVQAQEAARNAPPIMAGPPSATAMHYAERGARVRAERAKVAEKVAEAAAKRDAPRRAERETALARFDRAIDDATTDIRRLEADRERLRRERAETAARLMA